MQYRTLGKTGLRVSALGFGCSPLGGVFGPVDAAQSTLAVRAALDRGINFFDVAPYYGLTRAESALGEALRGVARDRYVLATKVGRYGASEFDFSAGRVAASVDESLRRLGVNYVDLIQCHDIEFGDLDQVVEETLPALRALRISGKVRFIGITGLPLPIFSYVLDRHSVDTMLSYCHYTLANTDLETLLPRLVNEQVGIINAAPLCMGLLTNAGPPAWHPADAGMKKRCAIAARYCSERGIDIAALALQFAMSEERINSTVIGMASVEEVNRNVEAALAPFDRSLAERVGLKPWPREHPE